MLNWLISHEDIVKCDKGFFFLVTASVNPTTCMTIADTSPISLMFQRYNEKKTSSNINMTLSKRSIRNLRDVP